IATGRSHTPADRSTDQRARSIEDRVEHGWGELASERVLLARVEAPDQSVRSARRLRPVTEAWLGSWSIVAEGSDRAERAVPAEGAERDDHTELPERRELAFEERQARVAFLRRGPIAGRRAAVDGGDVDVPERQPVVRRYRRGPVGEPGPVEGSEQE